jgi:hypothetical protein
MGCDLIRRGFRSMALAILGIGPVASIDAAGAAESSVPVPEVTVVAPRPPTAEELAGEAVPNFIASHATPSTVIHQITRWRNRICPVVQGLSPAFNAFVTGRIAAVAATVGAPYDAPQCKHNIEILFTAEPQQLLDQLAKRNPRLLGFHYPQQTKKLTTFRGPVQGWYVTSTRGDAGAEAIDEAIPLPIDDPQNIFTKGKVPPGRLGTRLATGQSSAIVSALIVVDTTKVTGLGVGSISDYLAMMILTHAQSPETCGALPSIIDLMASNCGGREQPTQLTAGDIAFLRALYSMDLRENLSLETSDIQNAMMREFKRK